MWFTRWTKPTESYSPYFPGSDTIRFRLLPESENNVYPCFKTNSIWPILRDIGVSLYELRPTVSASVRRRRLRRTAALLSPTCTPHSESLVLPLWNQDILPTFSQLHGWCPSACQLAENKVIVDLVSMWSSWYFRKRQKTWSWMRSTIVRYSLQPRIGRLSEPWYHDCKVAWTWLKHLPD